MITAFLIAVTSGILATILSSILFNPKIEKVWEAAGMMTGINSGGTPNLFAVGTALNTSDEVILITNSAQIFCGALYLFFLLSIGPSFFSKFLSIKKNEETNTRFDHSVNYRLIMNQDILKALGLITVIIMISIGLSHLIMDELSPTFVIVSVTTLAIISSYKREIHEWKGMYEAGDFLLLIFGVTVGMSSDFQDLLVKGKPYIGFVIVIFLLTIVLHSFVSRMFKIDRDSHIIASTAAIYGPVFIPQMIQTIQNRSLLLSGITCSLIGLAMGNYLGITIAYILQYLLG